MKKLFLSIGLVLALVMPGWSATYYMRADGTAVNKAAATGPASSAAACMNLAVHNGETFAAGDIILISSQGGTYTGDGDQPLITVPSSGSAENPIVYKNVDTESPVFQNSLTVTGFEDQGGGIWKAPLAVGVDAVFNDNVPLQQHTSAAVSSGQWYSDEADLYIYGDPTGHTIKASLGYFVGVCIKFTNKSNLSFVANTTGTIIFQYSNMGLFADAATAAVEGITIDGLTFNYCKSAVFINTLSNSYYSQGVFSNNESTRCYNFMRAYSEYGTQYTGYNSWEIYGNTGTDLGTTDGTTLWQSNVLTDREYAGLQNAQGCDIYDNVQTGGNSIFAILYGLPGGEVKNCNVYRNFVYQNNNRLFILSGTPSWTSNNNKAYNNIIYNETPASIAFDITKYPVYIVKPSAYTTPSVIYNNVIVGGEVGIYLYGDAAGAVGYTIKNNIIREMVNVNLFLNRADLTSFTTDYNCYAGTVVENGFAYLGEDPGYINIATWKSTTSQDEHSLDTDPLFVNASEAFSAATDFKLQPTSPCLGTGDYSVSTTVTSDYEGKAHYNEAGGISIGAYRSYKTGGSSALPSQ